MANSLVKLTLESNQYEKGLQQAQRSWNQFTKGIGLSVGKFTAVGAAIGAVSGALKVAKDAFFNNEQQLDEWGRAVSAAESTYQGFLSALNNGDIGGFLSNIDRIVNAARSAYNAIDELATYNAFNRMNVAEARANMSAAIGDFRMGNGSKEAVQESVNKLKEELGVRQTKEWDAYIESVRKIATERGANPDDVVKLLGGKYVDFENVKKSYVNESSFSGQTVKSLFGGATVAGAMSGFNFGTQTRRTPGTDAERLSVFARSLNDTELDKLQAMGEAAKNTKREIADLDKQLARVLNGRQGGSSGGGGGRSGGSTKTGPTYDVGSLAEAQAEVKRLAKLWNEAGADVRDQYLQPLIEAEAKVKSMQNAMNLQKEQAQGKLQGGWVMKTNLGADTFASNPTDIGKGLAKEDMPQILSPLQQINAEIERTQELMEMSPNSTFYQKQKEHLEELLLKQKEFTGDIEEGGKKSSIAFKSAAGAISSVGSALGSIDDPATKILSLVAQAIASVAAGAGKAISAKDTTSSGWAWIGAAAAITGEMIAIISQIHSATGYAHGGIVKGRTLGGRNVLGYAGGGTITGNTYSNDQIPIMANAGEVVLTKAMQGNLASQLEGGLSGLHLEAVVKAEQIKFMLNTNGKRKGKGEIVTTNFR